MLLGTKLWFTQGIVTGRPKTTDEKVLIFSIKKKNKEIRVAEL